MNVTQLSRNAIIILILLVVGGAIIGGWQVAVSIGVGGVLALINFRFMEAGVDRMIGVAGGTPERASLVRAAVGSLVRLLLIFGTLFAMIRFSFLNPLAALLGLSIYVISGMWGAVVLALHRKM